MEVEFGHDENEEDQTREEGNGDYEEEEQWMHEGDLIVINFWEFWNPEENDTEGGLYWKGTIQGPEVDSEIKFTFEMGDDGPMFWFPVMILGNNLFDIQTLH